MVIARRLVSVIASIDNIPTQDKSGFAADSYRIYYLF
jgi:hypothetical protein